MEEKFFKKIADALGINARQVENTVLLLDEGSTIPFIARYRKEKTDSLDEVVILKIRYQMEELRELEKRRKFILKTIREQGKLTPELEDNILEAESMTILEDLYLPYKPRKRTRATIARERGLEPLATLIFNQDPIEVLIEAEKFIEPEKGVNTADEALHGARDIVAEWISENAEIRKSLRELFYSDGILKCKLVKGKEEEGSKFRDYFEYEGRSADIPSHRMLAMRRGEKEMILSIDIQPSENLAIDRMERIVIKTSNQASEQVRIALQDSYKRLLKPSLETEARTGTKLQADEEAIRVFAENLRQLLMSAPLGQKRVMAIDPGFRTGCKIVCLDSQGKLLDHIAIYPHEPQKETTRSAAILLAMAEKNKIEAIAIGNGTAGRDTEGFVRQCGFPSSIDLIMVNESGASVYSASEVAREEFPDQDITVRGAVSIGRRLMDPLAELVKIDPKAIGVGQYQHDVDQAALKKSLDEVVMSCVNQVGVELNNSSPQLLSYVSGLGPQLANNIISFRDKHGPFRDRQELRQVPRLGEKAFEQCASFLRIRNSKNPLDSSAVHPERYELVNRMAKDLGCTLGDLMSKEDLRKKLDLKKYISEEVGMPTLKDILDELQKPGRDPRKKFEVFSFQEGINQVSDLKVGMTLPGIITNITRFGAFVDVGVHQDGLVHISHLSDNYVTDPAKVVTMQQKVRVTVLEVDAARKRISLSMKSDPFGKENAGKEKGSNKKAPEKAKGGDLQDKLEAMKGRFGKKD